MRYRWGERNLHREDHRYIGPVSEFVPRVAGESEGAEVVWVLVSAPLRRLRRLVSARLLDRATGDRGYAMEAQHQRGRHV